MAKVDDVERSPRAARRSADRDSGPRRRADIGGLIGRRLRSLSTGSKYERLKEAIIKAIVSGELRPGDQLPPEPEVAAATGLSLGTVRRCLARLAAEAVITREHGRGTFVSSHTQSVNDLWHLRFLAEDGKTLLPVHNQVLRRGLVTRKGPWSRVLGDSRAGYVRIERTANVAGRFSCYSDLYLSADGFRSILDAGSGQIEVFGLRNVLAERFNVPTVRATKTARCARVGPRVARVMGLEPGDLALQLEVIGYTYGEVPLSYQAIYVPPSAAPIDLSVQPHRGHFKRGYLQ